MKRFNALKKVNAKPMTRQEYNDLRGWNVSTSAKDEEGYLIVDPEIEANTSSYHGEVSWVPKENFERHYYKPDDQRAGEMCAAPQDLDHETNKVTKEHLDGLVSKSKIEYAVFGNKLTVAVITLPSNFKVTGEASCVDAKNFNKELGETYALENAIEKLWELEGYLLAERLHSRAEWLENQTGDSPVKCTAPQDPDHELTEDEVATLASNGSLCDCTWVEVDGTEHPIEKGDHVDFGTALHLMELGERVQREGWNGKGMFVYIVPAASYPAQRNAKGVLVGDYPNDMIPYSSYIALKSASGEVVPWTISQSDALATDWCLA